MTKLSTLLQYIMPQHALSRFAGLCAGCKIHWIKNFLIRYFVNKYPVNLDEAVESNPFSYPSFNDFFIRRLKPACRPIDNTANVITSPVDGCISQIGSINHNTIIQAKNHDYTVEALVADPTLAKKFHGGQFTTIYLAPHDYHRIHCPVDATLRQMNYVPGKLFSVNIQTTTDVPQLFANNERVITSFDTEFGPMAVVFVGAMIVGSIETTWSGTVTPREAWDGSWNYNLPVKKSAELGRFKLGSTVILLFNNKQLKWQEELEPETKVQFGQKIASII